jgi:hypothetical protein
LWDENAAFRVVDGRYSEYQLLSPVETWKLRYQLPEVETL